MRIGPYDIAQAAVLAPMAGVTDRPFRMLCRRLGAGMAVSEMVTSDPRLWRTRKSRQRLDHRGEPDPRSVQILGNEPKTMAEAARLNVDNGAQIIDINMGCPAKKVCAKAAGSALLGDEALVGRLLDAVVAAVEVPVTLKIRTGLTPQGRNGVRIARIAEAAGIQALAVHGRSRACAYRGKAEYDTIAEIKQAVDIPVIANGDIDSAAKAAAVLAYTGADAVMIGRAAQGRPWIFRQINDYLAHGEMPVEPDDATIGRWLEEHLLGLYDFYGEYMGVRIARKHIGWYLAGRAGGEALRRRINQQEEATQQLATVREYFQKQTGQGVRAA